MSTSKPIEGGVQENLALIKAQLVPFSPITPRIWQALLPPPFSALSPSPVHLLRTSEQAQLRSETQR